MVQRILITGASGGLGQVLFNSLKTRYDVLGTYFQNPQPNLTKLDLRDNQATLALAADFKPDLILNTVAWTDVDGCERDFRQAFALNIETALSLRLAIVAQACKLVHISTNDIFSGEDGLYTEIDPPQPLNSYARTKYIAEQLFMDLPEVLILRFTFLSWWTAGKTSFSRWLVQSLQQGQSVKLFKDQYNAPLYVDTLVEWLESLWHLNGVYHLASQRRSRLETGLALAQALNLNTGLIEAVSIHDSHLFAPRPQDVSLKADKIKQATGLNAIFETEIAKLAAALPDDLRQN
jgi:dTDP-4-dehydrorhamnose reductase